MRPFGTEIVELRTDINMLFFIFHFNLTSVDLMNESIYYSWVHELFVILKLNHRFRVNKSTHKN
jgi:hypothetical protein